MKTKKSPKKYKIPPTNQPNEKANPKNEATSKYISF